jgi:hypothetical protein
LKIAEKEETTDQVNLAVLQSFLSQTDRVFPSFVIKMHEKRGSFCSFLLKIAEKEEKTGPLPV